MITSSFPDSIVTPFLSALLLFSAASLPLNATQFVWDGGADDDYWGLATNWDLDLGIPNSEDDNIVLGGATVNLADETGADASFIVNRISTNNANSSLIFQNVTDGTGRIIFQSSTGTSTISSVKNSGGTRRTRFDVGITLNNDLIISSLGGTGVQFTRSIISGIDPETSLPFLTNVTLAGSPVGSGSGAVYTSFQAANSYNGKTIFNASLSASLTSGSGGAKLQITGNDYAPTGSVFEFLAGTMGGSGAVRNQSGFFNLNGFNQRIGGLEGAAGTSVGMISNIGATGSILTIDNAANHVFNGFVSDSYTSATGTTALVKEGAGTQTMDNAVNAFSGGTTVSEGVLLLSTGHAAASTGTGSTGTANSVVLSTGVEGLYIGQRVTSASGNIPVGARIIGIIAASDTIILSSAPTAGVDIELNFGEASSLGIDNALGTGGNVLINGGTLASDVEMLWSPGSLTLESGALDLNQAGAGALELNEDKGFTMSGGSWELDLGTEFDQIQATGTLGAFSITGGTFALGVTGAGFDYGLTYNVLAGFASGSVSGLTFTGYDDIAYTANLDDSGVLSFAPVPEPGAGVLLLLSLAGITVINRRRRH